MEWEAGTGGSFLGSGNHEVGENNEAPFKGLEGVNMYGWTMGQRQRQPLAGSGHISFWLNWDILFKGEAWGLCGQFELLTFLFSLSQGLSL